MRATNEIERQALEAASSRDAWDRVALAIKRNHGGQYPSDWYDVVLAPNGIMARHAARGLVLFQAITANSWDELLDKVLPEPKR